jgi:hypothetical protein
MVKGLIISLHIYFHHSNPRQDHHIPQDPHLFFEQQDPKLGHLYPVRDPQLHFTYRSHPSLC